MPGDQSTIHVFNDKPIGIEFASRNGTIYVGAVTKKAPSPPPPAEANETENDQTNDTTNNTQEKPKNTKTSESSIPSKIAKKLGMNTNDDNNNNDNNKSQLKSKPIRQASDAEIKYKLEKMRYDKLLSLVGRRILRVQEIDVTLFDGNEINELINNEKLPIYIKFGESIDLYEKTELSHLKIERHKAFFKQMCFSPPTQYVAMDVQRMTLLFFSLFALDLLYDLDKFFDKMNENEKEKEKGNETIQNENDNNNNDNVDSNDTTTTTKEKEKEKENEKPKYSKESVINWIYAQQIIGDPNSKDINKRLGGFRGGSFLGIPFDNNNRAPEKRIVNEWDRVNLAATHNGICLLIGLGDDLSRLDKCGIIYTLKTLQNAETGVFASMYGGEEDLRFLYCACIISYLLNDWDGVNKLKAIKFVKECQRYDGGIAFSDSLEGHGGSTFVAVSSLVTMNALDEINVDKLLRWCILNQGNGYKGRPEKPCDTCYSFWIGAVISLISSVDQLNEMKNNQNNDENEQKNEKNGKNENINDEKDNFIPIDEQNDEIFRHSSNKKFYEMTCKRKNRFFNLTCQSGFGGFSKYPHIIYGDIMHGYMGLAGLTMVNSQFDQGKFEGRKEMFPLTSSTASRSDLIKNIEKNQNYN